MRVADWIALAVIVAGAFVLAWWLHWRRVRDAAAVRTRAQIGQERADVEAQARAKKDAEAWDEYKRNFGD